jgi:hypothetical protein
MREARAGDDRPNLVIARRVGANERIPALNMVGEMVLERMQLCLKIIALGMTYQNDVLIDRSRRQKLFDITDEKAGLYNIQID